MKPILLTAVFLSTISFSLLAQKGDLHIYYDFYDNSPRYVTDGKPSGPYVKEGKRIIVHIQEFDDTYMNANISKETESISFESSDLDMAKIETFFPVADDVSVSSSFGMEELESFSIDDLPPPAAGIAVRDSEKVMTKEQAEAVLKNFDATRQRIIKLNNEIQEHIINAETDIIDIEKITKADTIVKQIMQQKNIRPSVRKNMSENFIKEIFEVDNLEEMTLDDIYVKTRKSSPLKRQLIIIKGKYNALDLEAQKLSNIITDINDNYLSAAGDALPLGRLNEAVQYQPILETELAIARKEITYIDGIIATINDSRELQELVNLWIISESIRSNPFEYRSSYETSEGDYVKITPSITVEGLKNEPISQSAETIRVKVYGKWKFDASVGISLGYLGDNNNTYYVNNGIIGEENQGGIYYPIITTFMHVYRTRKGKTAIGANLGIGYTLVENQSTERDNYFGGISIMMGEKNRFIISSGLLVTRAESLARGYQVGDTYDVTSGIDDLTKKSPKVGLYLGISFNFTNKSN